MFTCESKEMQIEIFMLDKFPLIGNQTKMADRLSSRKFIYRFYGIGG